MDTTREYIEMSKALPDEIRDSWEPTEGDYFAEVHGNNYTDINIYYNCPEEDNLWLVKNPIWLRRQDQLQDMLDDIFSNREIVPLTAKLHDVCMHLIQKHNFSGRTMEQLWLAFVMHEKYSMEWTGKEWIKC